jgi:hypothetical protein
MPGRLTKLPGISGPQSPVEMFKPAKSAGFVAKGFIFRGLEKRDAEILV